MPGLVGRLLLGVELPGIALLVTRCFGIALLALGMASWPGDRPMEGLIPALRGMALYNALIALYLGYVGGVDGMRGPLLWPAVGIHAVVALLMIRPRSTSPSVP
jgi:hypothetical protein